MSIDDRPTAPDYELDDVVFVETAEQMKVVSDTTRGQILDLVMERAATVSELALALDRPKSSVAYHVKLLCEIGMLQVVRTRKVRAIDERFYGRTGRTIVFGRDPQSGAALLQRGFLAEANAEAPVGGDYLGTLRHARIAEEDVDEFFERVAALAEEFTRLPRSGDTVMGFVAAIYPTDHPSLPPAAPESIGDTDD